MSNRTDGTAMAPFDRVFVRQEIVHLPEVWAFLETCGDKAA